MPVSQVIQITVSPKCPPTTKRQIKIQIIADLEFFQDKFASSKFVGTPVLKGAGKAGKFAGKWGLKKLYESAIKNSLFTRCISKIDFRALSIKTLDNHAKKCYNYYRNEQ